LNRLSWAHDRYRQTDDRQTDGRYHIANVNVSSRSLKIGPLFSSLLETLQRNGSGSSGPKNLVSGIGAASGCKKHRLERSGSGRSRSGSHRNRFKRQAEILALPLRSHAVLPSTKILAKYAVMKSLDTVRHVSCLESVSVLAQSRYSNVLSWLCLKFPCLVSCLMNVS